MSYPSDKELTLSGTFERQPMCETGLADALEKSKTSVNRKNLDAGIDIERRTYQCYVNFYTASEYQAKTQKAKLAQAETEYKNNLADLKLAIINSYNIMCSTYNQHNYIDKVVELQESQSQAKYTAYELGLATATEYLDAQRQLNELKLNRVDAEISAYMTGKGYELSFGL